MANHKNKRYPTSLGIQGCPNATSDPKNQVVLGGTVSSLRLGYTSRWMGSRALPSSALGGGSCECVKYFFYFQPPLRFFW